MAKKRSGTGPADRQPGSASSPDDTVDESSNGSSHATGDTDIDGEAQVAGNAADDTDYNTVTDDDTVAGDTVDDEDDGSDEYDEYDGDEDDGEDDEASDGRPNSPVWTTGWQRLSKTFVTPPGQSGQRASRSKPAAQQPTPDFSAMTETQKRNLVNQIDPTERKIGYIASGLAVVLTLVSTIPYMVRRVSVATTTKPSGHTCANHYTYTTHSGSAATCNTVYPTSHYAFSLILLLVFSAAIFVTVRIGRRAPLAFTLVLTGLAIGSVIANTIIVLPFIFAGGWLLLRAWRSQKYGSPSAKAPLPGYTPPRRGPAPKAGAASGRSGGSTTNASRRSRKNQPPPSPTGRTAPSANKRYTPKAPPKKKTPPPD
jgi:flagellar biogenesis protein FliO